MLTTSEDYQLSSLDCIKGMQALEKGGIDLVVTSPPYNIGIEYGRYDDDLGAEEYLKWSGKWIREVAKVLVEEGSFFLNVGGSPTEPTMPHQLVMIACKYFKLQNTFHWVKSITVEPREGEPLSVGHFKPINSYRFVNDCHEYIFHFTKTGKVPIDRQALGVPYQDKSNIKRWSHTNGKDLRCRGNTWFIPYKTIQSRIKDRPHPASFPVELVENCIKLHGVDKVQTAMDPFLGIGSSAIAALNCGVPKFVGFDIDAEYLKVARKLVTERQAQLSEV